MFHLGWFVASGYALQAWGELWSGDGAHDWLKPELYADLAMAMERASMDCLMFEDSSMVPDVYGGSFDYALRTGHIAPKHDPIPLLPLLSQRTERLGLAATVSTTFYPPFLLARLMATLDHISMGRIGCNLVTSSNARAMQNFGMDELIDHDLRYEMAQEWVDVAFQLWSSWASDALVADDLAGVFVDPRKVSPIHFRGRHHTVRGPLNTLPSPQGRPVIFQAGGSPAGRAFGARNADIVMADVMTPQDMKKYRDDIRRARSACGLDPDSCKVLFLLRVFLGETNEDAGERQAAYRAYEATNFDRRLAGLSTGSGIDFSNFALDEPLPEVSTQGHQSVLAAFAARAGGRTLREVAALPNKLEVCGSPETVAAIMGEIMEEVGGDGFLLMNPIVRKTIAELTDGLAPALARRGLTRPGYDFKTFRQNLLAF